VKKKMEDWIIEADIASMQAAMESGVTSSEEITNVYIKRIRMYDNTINSILELNPEAVEIAKLLDKERMESGSRGRLHGIPILLKDNIDTNDQMHTSAGSVALAESYAAEDAFVASRLRAAGAVLLGKANMTEWANFMSDTMWSGYSSRGGLVLNPYGPGELFVGGSSSGSAAAVAANLSAAAMGTETSGSIIGPASQNCVVGIKPTVGLISRAGIIPIAYSQDTPGPIARTVADAAIILGALTDIDDKDPMTASSRNRAYRDYTPFLQADYLPQARIGIPRQYYKDLDEDCLAIMEAAIQILLENGATIIDPVVLPCDQVQWNSNVTQYEFRRDLNHYLGKLAEHIPVHSLEEVITYNEEHADVALKYGQSRLIKANDSELTEQQYQDSLHANWKQSRDQGIDYVLREHSLDALMFPGFHGAHIAGYAGYPLITVPAGFAEHGITVPEGYVTKGPHGVTFSGTAYSEPVLIRIAYGFEQATRFRFPPQLL
jgi:amidase